MVLYAINLIFLSVIKNILYNNVCNCYRKSSLKEQTFSPTESQINETIFRKRQSRPAMYLNTFKNRLDLDLKGYYSFQELRGQPQVTRCNLQLQLLLQLTLG